MLVDAPSFAELDNIDFDAKRIKDEGFDGLYTVEANRDVFFPLLLASKAQPDLSISTGVAIALPRNPMHLAYQAWDLQRFSQGKFTLGIGSQMKTHIEKRFGIGFERPMARMKDYLQAMNAIFSCWQDGEKMQYEGEFFKHTLMTPMFNPGPNPFGKPKILIGAQGPKMTEMTAELADGININPFTNEAYFRGTQMPAIEKGLQKAGRSADDFFMHVTALVVTGANEKEFQEAYEVVKSVIAFYASTPNYKTVMEAIGYGELSEKFNTYSKENKWLEMNELVTDEMMQAFCIVGEPHTIADKIIARYGDYADRISLYAPYTAAFGVWKNINQEIKAKHQ